MDNNALNRTPRIDHEDRDVNVRAVIWFCAGLIALAVVVHFALFYLFRIFKHQEEPHDLPLSMITSGRTVVPPEPRLQYDPPRDLEQMRAEEQKVLDGYGWADPQARTVYIPIAQAMKLAVQRGTYVVQTGAAGTQPPVAPVVTGAAGSGTQTQPAPQSAPATAARGVAQP